MLGTIEAKTQQDPKCTQKNIDIKLRMSYKQVFPQTKAHKQHYMQISRWENTQPLLYKSGEQWPRQWQWVKTLVKRGTGTSGLDLHFDLHFVFLKLRKSAFKWVFFFFRCVFGASIYLFPCEFNWPVISGQWRSWRRSWHQWRSTSPDNIGVTLSPLICQAK